MNICFVTQEFPGIGRSGGIGRYVESLVNLLKHDHSVTVLYVGEIQGTSLNSLDCGFDLLFLNHLPRRAFSGGINSYYGQSLQIYDWIKSQQFDHINFADFQGLGTATIQGKMSGQLQHRPIISITSHGPNYWALEANGINFQIAHHAEIDFLERYSVEHCDLLLLPSKFIEGWMLSKGWSLSPNRKLLQNPLCDGPKQYVQKKDVKGKKVVAFFGRLEPRKGVHDFLTIAEKYYKEARFILVGGESPGNDPFRDFSQDSVVRKIERLSNLNSKEAQEFFRLNDALVVVPSLSENCPYTVIETVQAGNRIIARSVGGIPELLPQNSLFSDVKQLDDLIAEYISVDDSVGSVDLKIPNSVACQNYQELFNTSFDLHVTGHHIYPKGTSFGVVIAHFNQSELLPYAVESVRNQKYQDFECVIIDDGSSDKHLQEFRSLKAKFHEDHRFVFIEKTNEDVGATRNFGVTFLKSKLVTFLDSDDIMREDCLDSYFHALNSGSQIVTSHFDIFKNIPRRKWDVGQTIGAFEPFGACLDTLWYKNTVGGANFATSKEVFDIIGGFVEERGSTHQDWHFLTKAALTGVRIGIVPERLLMYRVLEKSMSRTRSHTVGQKLVIDEYTRTVSANTLSLFHKLMMERVVSGESVPDKPMTILLADKIRGFVESYFPIGSWRWRIVSRIASVLLKS